MRIRKAEKKDWLMLLEWRNDEITRKNSINSNLVNEHDHKEWFFSSLKSEKREIFIVEENEFAIGTLRVDFKDGDKILSWTVAPEYRGKGYAKKMLKMLVDKLEGELVAFIKPDNTASIKIAEYAGFKLFKSNTELLVYKIKDDEDRKFRDR
jgi:RimJ/RimL family protein N-acetyltransferase